MDFQKVICENFKKTIHFTINILIYTGWVTDILKFYEVLFCTYCEGLLCLYIPLYMNKTHPTSGDEKGQ